MHRLSRSEDSDARLEALGATPVRGDLDHLGRAAEGERSGGYRLASGGYSRLHHELRDGAAD